LYEKKNGFQKAKRTIYSEKVQVQLPSLGKIFAEGKKSCTVKPSTLMIPCKLGQFYTCIQLLSRKKIQAKTKNIAHIPLKNEMARL